VQPDQVKKVRLALFDFPGCGAFQEPELLPEQFRQAKLLF